MTGEPSNGTTENCLSMRKGTGQFDAEDCSLLISYFCERSEGIPQTVCNESTGWIPHGDRCYFFSPHLNYWLDAREECRAFVQADLAVVDDTVQKFLEMQLWVIPVPMWIGLNNLNKAKYTWLDDDAPPAYTRWLGGRQPHPRSTWHYVLAHHSYKGEVGHWVNSKDQAGYMCEQPRVIDMGNCSESACQNGGTCLPSEDQGYECLCPVGYNGTLCENLENLCDEGWGLSVTGLCFRVIQAKLNQAQAETTCRSLGGHLAEPASIELQHIMYRIIRRHSHMRYWIGLQQNSSGSWLWNSGNEVSWIMWTSDIASIPLQPCVALVANRNYMVSGWVYEHCAALRSLVCQKPAYKNSCLSTPCQNGGTCVVRGAGYTCVCPDTHSGLHCSITSSSAPGCTRQDIDKGPYTCTGSGQWHVFGARCYQVSRERMTWFNARLTCIRHGGDLAVVTGINVQLFVEALQAKVGRHIWLGAYSQKVADIWNYQSVKDVGYSYPGDANRVKYTFPPILRKLESCAYLTTIGYGHFTYERFGKGYICEKQAEVNWCSSCSRSPDPLTCHNREWYCDQLWQPHGHSCFRFFPHYLTWSKSQDVCQQHGGHLAKVQDGITNRFIARLITGVTSGVWLGLVRNMQLYPPDFQWVDNTLVTWSMWAKRGVSNSWKQQCGLFRSRKNHIYAKWDDEFCTLEYKFVCQKPASPCPCNSVHQPVTDVCSEKPIPRVSINCVKNCQEWTSPTTALSLVAVCSDNCDYHTALTYLWSVNTSLTWGMDTSTHQKAKGLLIYPGLLQQDQSYSISVQMSNASCQQQTSYSSITIKIGSPPIPGTCNPSPLQGVVMSDLFTVSCDGFIDDDLPLSYAYYFNTGAVDVESTHNALGTLLFVSPSSDMQPTLLPVGLAEFNYTVDITVVVADIYGSSVSVTTSVTVLGLSGLSEDAVENVLSSVVPEKNVDHEYNEEEEVNALLKAVSIASALNDLSSAPVVNSTLLDNYSYWDNNTLWDNSTSMDNITYIWEEVFTDPKVFRTQMRKQMMGSLQSVHSSTPVAYQHKAKAMVDLTAATDELTEEMQLQAALSFSNISSALLSQLRQSGNDSEALIVATEEAARTLLSGAIGALTRSINISRAVNSTAPQNVSYQQMDVTKTSLHVINDVSAVMLSSAIPGAEPVTLNTSIMTLKLSQNTLKELNTEKLTVDVGAGVPSVMFTPPLIEEAELNADTVVGAQVFHARENPYSWARSAGDANSEVVGLALRDGRGDELALHNLSAPLTFTLPTTTTISDAENLSLSLKLVNPLDGVPQNLTDDYIALIVTTVPEAASFQFEFTAEDILPPGSPGSQLIQLVFVSQLELPPVRQDLLLCLESNTCPSVWVGCHLHYSEERKIDVVKNSTVEYIITRNASLNQFSLFGDVPEGLGQNISVYVAIVGIVYECVLDDIDNILDDIDDTLEDFGNYTDENTTEGVPLNSIETTTWTLETEGLTANMTSNSTAPVSHPPEMSFYITLSVKTLTGRCFYWEDSLNDWRTNGCKPGPTLEPSTLLCECSHLSTFTGGFFVAPNSVELIGDAALFLTFFDNPVVVLLVVFAWLLYVPALIWARHKDKQDEGKVGITVLEDNNPQDKYCYLVAVLTGWRAAAGTTSKVGMSMRGQQGRSASHILTDPHRTQFEAGSEDWFLMTSPHCLGGLKY